MSVFFFLACEKFSLPTAFLYMTDLTRIDDEESFGFLDPRDSLLIVSDKEILLPSSKLPERASASTSREVNLVLPQISPLINEGDILSANYVGTTETEISPLSSSGKSL
jgi:hypothetical protein